MEFILCMFFWYVQYIENREIHLYIYMGDFPSSNDENKVHTVTKILLGIFVFIIYIKVIK